MVIYASACNCNKKWISCDNTVSTVLLGLSCPHIFSVNDDQNPMELNRTVIAIRGAVVIRTNEFSFADFTPQINHNKYI